MAKKTTTPTSNLSSEKAKAVEAAIAQIEKNYGKGSIMALGQQPVEDILRSPRISPCHPHRARPCRSP